METIIEGPFVVTVKGNSKYPPSLKEYKGAQQTCRSYFVGIQGNGAPEGDVLLGTTNQELTLGAEYRVARIAWFPKKDGSKGWVLPQGAVQSSPPAAAQPPKTAPAQQAAPAAQAKAEPQADVPAAKYPPKTPVQTYGSAKYTCATCDLARDVRTSLGKECPTETVNTVLIRLFGAGVIEQKLYEQAHPDEPPDAELESAFPGEKVPF